jgi:hypothetical protein
MATTKIRSSSIEDGQVSNADLSATIAVTGGQIADDAVTLAKMAGGTDGNLITYDASGDPAYVATGAATNILTSNGAGAAPTFQAAAAGGLSYAQQWRLTSDLSCSNVDTYLYANWEKPESEDSPGVIGTDMVVDATTSATLSGAWTFPATGVWYVAWRCQTLSNTSNHDFTPKLWTTDDNGSNWYVAASAMRLNRTGYTQPNLVDYIVSISDVTTHKVRVSGVVSVNASVIESDTNENRCAMTFIKLGD